MSLVNLFFNKIKEFIKVKNNDLSFLNVGDIVYAKRYDNEKEMLKIPLGHREGPFVVIKQTKNKTYVLQMTSKLHCENVWKHIYYPLGKLTYNTVKNSYINTTKVYELNDSKYISLFGHLTDDDLNRLYKSIYIILHSSYNLKPDLIDDDLKFKFSVGDLVKCNDEKLLILEETKKEYVCIRVSNKIKAKNKLFINNTYYSFNFLSNCEISKKADIKLLDTFNSGELKLILDEKEKYLNNIKIYKDLDYITVGSLIKYKNNLYYVYGENNDEYNVLLLEEKYDKNKKMIYIKVNGGIYYSRNSKINLKKNSDIKKKKMANKSEIEENAFAIESKKNDKKLFKKNDISNISNFSTEYIPMMIIKNINTNKNYLILSKKDNVIELINIDDMKDYFYYELQDGNIPFKLYRIMDELEFYNYKKKIDEFMMIVNSFK